MNNPSNRILIVILIVAVFMFLYPVLTTIIFGLAALYFVFVYRSKQPPSN